MDSDDSKEKSWEEAEIKEGQLEGISKTGRNLTLKEQTGIDSGMSGEEEIPIFGSYIYSISDNFSDNGFVGLLELLGHDVIITLVDNEVVKVIPQQPNEM